MDKGRRVPTDCERAAARSNDDRLQWSAARTVGWLNEPVARAHWWCVLIPPAVLWMFSWTQLRGMVDLGTLGGTVISFGTVDPTGHLVAGSSYTRRAREVHATLWVLP